jgi:2-dehydro-3-deoxyphosphogluconate aldolase / (4S)-4-hydroxy-2-oxoglutarate aldolase
VTRDDIVARIEAARLIAILRFDDAKAVGAVVDALVEGGVTLIELTMTMPNAAALIADVTSRVPASVAVGAGTVLDTETARRVIDAGARFVVSPVCRPELIDLCHHHGAAMLPGCFTPTEILTAWEAGADFVKVFPARSLPPTFIRDVREPLPQVKLIPTGGISAENAADWLRAGATAVGVGGALLDRQAIASGKFDVIAAASKRLVAAVKAA